jgi:hypothetical protein
MLAQGAGLDQGQVSMRQETTPPSRTMYVDTSVRGTMLWDAGAGTPVWRDVQIEGRHTSSSSEFGKPVHMQQLSGMQMVAAFGVEGQAPPALAALRAPRIDHPPAASELPIVPFDTLGMNALTLPVMPDAGRALSLPPSVVRARLLVEENGRIRSVEVYDGYAALEPAIVAGLRAMLFPASEGKPYVVDVEVWVGR